MPAQEKVVVRSSSPERIIGYLCFGLFSLFFIGFTILVLSGEFSAEDQAFVLFGYLFLILALCGSAWLFYREERPRIVMKGDQLICYPRWKAKIAIGIHDITARKTDLKTRKNAFIGGAVGYAVTKGQYSYSLLDITYYVGNTPIISIDTDMKNAGKLDSLIRKSLESKKTSQDEPRP